MATTATVSVTVLGPVTLRVDGVLIALSGLERGLLAKFALSHDARSSWPALSSWLWDERQPASPRNRVQALVSGLRRKAAGLGARDFLVTEGIGYRFAPEVEVDYRRWRELVAQARTDAPRRRECLHAALDLFGATALDGVAPSAECDVEATRLEQERIRVVEERIEADLDAGELAGLDAELAVLVVEHPLREGLLAQQIRCLAAVGRQAEALAVYRAAYQRFVEELGVEPGPQLRAAHEQVLAGTAAVDPAATAAVAAAVAVPATLPRGPATFVGRGAELADLRSAATGSLSRAVVVAVQGLSGAGKTALAVEAGRLTREQFPDGCLYLDLSGETGRSGPTAVLGLFLRWLGIPADSVPDGHDARVAEFRSAIYDKRILIVLDDADSDAQVADLLPTGAGSMAIVTSRASLAHADRTLRLGPLPAADALELLRDLVGAERIAAEPEAAADVVERCGRLPLALRLVAARAVTRPDLTLRRIADRLRDDADQAEDAGAGPLTGIRLAYERLPAAEQALLRAAVQLPAVPLSPWACAALTGSDAAGERALDRLIDAGLVDPITRDGLDAEYRVHDLARRHVRKQPAEPGDIPDPAVRLGVRLLGELLVRLPTYPLQLVPAPPQSVPAVTRRCTAADTVRFFRSERERILTIARAVAPERPDLGWQLLVAAANPAQVDVDLLHWQDVAAAVRAELPAGEQVGTSHLDLVEAALRYEAGHAAEAGEQARQARRVLVLGGHTSAAVAAAVIAGRAARVIGDRATAEQELHWASSAVPSADAARSGWVELAWAILHNDYDELEPARASCARALAAFDRSPDLIGRATATYSLAHALTRLGAATDAVPLCDAALEQFAALGDQHSYVVALDARAEARLQLGFLGPALADAEAAADRGERLRNRYAAAHARRTVGRALAALGRLDDARAALTSSAEQFEALGRPLSVEASLRALAALDSDHENGVRSDLAAG